MLRFYEAVWNRFVSLQFLNFFGGHSGFFCYFSKRKEKLTLVMGTPRSKIRIVEVANEADPPINTSKGTPWSQRSELSRDKWGGSKIDAREGFTEIKRSEMSRWQWGDSTVEPVEAKFCFKKKTMVFFLRPGGWHRDFKKNKNQNCQGDREGCATMASTSRGSVSSVEIDVDELELGDFIKKSWRRPWQYRRRYSTKSFQPKQVKDKAEKSVVNAEE